MQESLEKLLSSYIPMSEQSFLILLSLLKPRHGYGIMQIILEQSSGRINLGPSTVYTVLYKLEQDGFIEVVSEEDRRKVYLITKEGIQLLKAEAKRLDSLSKISKKLLREADNEEVVI